MFSNLLGGYVFDVIVGDFSADHLFRESLLFLSFSFFVISEYVVSCQPLSSARTAHALNTEPSF